MTERSSRLIRRAAPVRWRSGAASSASAPGPRSMAGRRRPSPHGISSAGSRLTGSTFRSIPTRFSASCSTMPANYVKPDIVRKLLGPTVGRGLLSSDGALWREQRRIVAASFAPSGGRSARPRLRARGARGSGDLERGRARHGRSRRLQRRCGSSPPPCSRGDARLTTPRRWRISPPLLTASARRGSRSCSAFRSMPWSLRGRRSPRPGLSSPDALRAGRGAACRGGEKGDFLDGLIAALRSRFDRGRGAETLRSTMQRPSISPATRPRPTR